MHLERKLDIGIPDDTIENRVNDTVREIIDFTFHFLPSKN
jgi:hypothetical protein